jgi:GTP-binding protein HflX
LPQGRELTISDTVGFIRKLPTTLVEAFQSTLDEINSADLILHVVDASSPESSYQQQAVELVLEQIGADGIVRIDVYNKADLLSSAQCAAIAKRHPHALLVSSKTGEGIDALIGRLARSAAALDRYMTVLLPYTSGALASLAHGKCQVLSEEHTESGTQIAMFCPQSLVARFSPFELEGGSEA